MRLRWWLPIITNCVNGRSAATGLHSIYDLLVNMAVTPHDHLIMEAILKDMDVDDYDPSVVGQMLEFAYR